MFNWFYRARDRYFALPRFQFEAITFGLALMFGLFVMPALTYLAGHISLKDYAHGGLFDLYGDVFKGLAQLKPSFWILVGGPFVFLTLARLFRWLLRKT